MIEGKTILAVIPARGGSKGLPRKNIRLLACKPLIAWTIEAAKKSKFIDRLILSSEDEEIISVAKAYGCEVPFIRPQELAEDDTPGISPLLHAIENLHESYDYVILLQPTSPLRSAESIDRCVEFFVQRKARFCVSVTEADKTPYWMYTINNNLLKPFIISETYNRRQDIPKTYVLNGAIYIAETKSLIIEESFLNENTIGFLMVKSESVDIDTESDFLFAEFMINHKKFM